MHGVGPRGFELQRPREEIFFDVEVERAETGGTSQGVARTGIAVQQFNRVLRAFHEGFVNRLTDDHAAQRHRTRSYSLGEGDDVRKYAIALGREGMPETAEAAGDFVENQQNVIFVADRS